MLNALHTGDLCTFLIQASASQHLLGRPFLTPLADKATLMATSLSLYPSHFIFSGASHTNCFISCIFSLFL